MSPGSGPVETRDGESDMVTFEIANKPDPGIIIREVGEPPDIRYRYDWDERGDPTPEDFERVGMLEVKLVSAMTDWDGDVLEAAEEAHEAIVNLRETMSEQRGLEESQRREVRMGNLEGLPEVEKR